MRRVHRSLDAQQVAALRSEIAAKIPESDLPISELIRSMRISIKRSQSEYASLQSGSGQERPRNPGHSKPR